MKKNLALISVAVVLAVIYVIFFTNWLRPKVMHISHTTRPLGRGGQPILMFGLAGRYQVTEIKVVPAAEWQTNKLAQPLWHLVSTNKSEPLNHFIYGQNIRDMQPEVKGSRAAPLTTNVIYRILVSAGATKGWDDFQINAGAMAQRVRPNH